MNKSYAMCRLPAAIGELHLVASADALVGVYFADQKRVPPVGACTHEDGAHPVLRRAVGALHAYLAGEARSFDLPLAPQGTDFQRAVWEALRGIEYGRTISYADLAQRLGMPRAVRAVAAAVGRNPLGIVIPCHRVIGANGALTGYAGGLARKRALLALERARAVPDLAHAA